LQILIQISSKWIPIRRARIKKQAKQRRTRIWNIRYAIFDKMLILIALSNMQKQIPMISWWKLLLLTEAVQPKFTCCRSYGFVTFEAQ
jgi:hypothetical protein